MLFTCCHPALAADARMALTLRSVAGLTVPEIARAFLSSESAMERRLVRARRKVSRRADPVPRAARRPAARTAGRRAARRLPDLHRGPHRHARAPRPCAATCARRRSGSRACSPRLMPDEAEALGLLALLLLTDARRAARVRADGSLVALEEQDRTAWDAARIAEGTGVLERALRLAGAGPYAVQAAIAALHAQAPAVGGDRLAADRRALHRARAARPLAGGDGQPRGRRGVRRGARRPAWRCSTGSREDARLDALPAAARGARGAAAGAPATRPAPPPPTTRRSRTRRTRPSAPRCGPAATRVDAPRAASRSCPPRRRAS